MLVCDDDTAVVESLSALLRHHGYQPIGVTDGATAIRLIDQQHPAAVLLDLMMPGTTGAQVLASLRSRPETRHIPVIVISGLGPEDEPAVAESTEGWLIKPVSEQRLVQTVALAVSGREHGATVLLVEDDEGLASVVGTLLAAEGLEVVHAASAADAVVRGREQRPDVIVLDLHLPDGDGSDGRGRIPPTRAHVPHPLDRLQRRGRGQCSAGRHSSWVRRCSSPRGAPARRSSGTGCSDWSTR